MKIRIRKTESAKKRVKKKEELPEHLWTLDKIEPGRTYYVRYYAVRRFGTYLIPTYGNLILKHYACFHDFGAVKYYPSQKVSKHLKLVKLPLSGNAPWLGVQLEPIPIDEYDGKKCLDKEPESEILLGEKQTGPAPVKKKLRFIKRAKK